MRLRRRPILIGAPLAVAGAGALLFLFRPAPPPVSLDPPPSVLPVADGTTPEGHWVVAPGSGSFVGYRAKEMLTFDIAEIGVPNEAVGRTEATNGRIVIEDGRLMSATITADLSRLRSDLEMRDGHLAEAFAFDVNPTAEFVLAQTIDLASVDRGATVNVAARGNLALNQVTKEVTFPLQARWNGPTIQVAGALPIRRADFELETGQFFFFRVAEEFTIEVELTFVRACGDKPCPPASAPPLTAASQTPRQPASAPPAGRPASGRGALVFVGTDLGGDFGQVNSRHLYRVRVDGSALVQLTDGAGEFDPAIASDGRIAFTRAVDPGIELWVRSSKGNESRVETVDDLTRLDFAPDGTMLAAIRNTGTIDTTPGTDLVLVEIASGGVTDVLVDPGRKDLPDWSPDGRSIAFGMLSPGSNGDDIFVVNPDGSGLTRITERTGYEFAPDWSPDGRRLLYGSEAGLVVRELETGDEVTVYPGSANAPAWSPDGRLIAFESDDGIWIANADGTGAHRLDLDFDVASSPVWVP
jgi:Tol biopolymer transport system component/polyisoprenoid-binding protein YceI